MELAIKAVKNGNKERFKEIVLAYENEIYRYILKMVLDNAVAEDLTQDVLVTAYIKIHQYKLNISFRAWLYKIAKNKTLNYIKRESKHAEIQKQMSYDNSSYIEDSVNDNYDEDIECALNQLNDKEKSLLILKAVEELSYKELSVVFNRSESTLRKQFERAKNKFRKHYDGRDDYIL